MGAIVENYDIVVIGADMQDVRLRWQAQDWDWRRSSLP